MIFISVVPRNERQQAGNIGVNLDFEDAYRYRFGIEDFMSFDIETSLFESAAKAAQYWGKKLGREVVN